MLSGEIKQYQGDYYKVIQRENLINKFIIKRHQNQQELSQTQFYKNILDQIMYLNNQLMILWRRCINKYNNIYFQFKKKNQNYNYLNHNEIILKIQKQTKQLFELDSQEQQQSKKLTEDNHFIKVIQSHFELLFNSSEYFQTADTFEDCIYENPQIKNQTNENIDK
ncbi:unnamed protein product [Paramecium octaurelia]|nr:unnamed protein product [Paramecium octaurelia]